MADNTTIPPGTGGDTIASDDIASGVAAGAKVQRVKNGWGSDNTYVDVDATNPLPTVGVPDSSASGTMAALNATVALALPSGATTWTVRLGGTFAAGSVVSFEGSIDSGTTWDTIPLAGRFGVSVAPAISVTGSLVTSFAFNTWTGAAINLTNVRVRLSTFTAADSVTATIRAGIAAGVVFPTQYFVTQGVAATGAAVLGNPVLVGGSDGTLARSIKTDTSGRQIMQQTPADLVISATAAVSTGVTATLPAVASNFHYITAIHIAQVSSTTAGAAGAPLVVTTTNLPGSLSFTRPTLVAGGDIKEFTLTPNSPIKSSVVNTATTIVAPVHTNIIWRINVHYYTAP